MTTGSFATFGSQSLSYSLPYFADWCKYLAKGRFAFPLAEREFVAEDEIEPRALQRAVDGFAGDLLPPSAGLFIPHKEILVVDSRQIKMQDSTVYASRPHQTGVTERSIGDGHRHATDHVIHDVVICHFADGISS